MKAERRHELQENSLIHGITNLPALWKAYGSKIALGLVLALLAFALVRMWTSNRAESKRQFSEQLTAARSDLEGLRVSRETPMRDRRDPEMASQDDFDQEKVAANRKQIWSKVETAVANVLKDSSDPTQLAEAKLLRADLNYHFGLLALVGDLPGAATRPALKIGQSPDQYFAVASQNYNEIVNQAAALPEQAAAARLGLGAIFEDQQNYPSALEQYKAVLTAVPGSISAAIAQNRQDLIFRIKPPLLVGPPQSQESMLRAMMRQAGIDPDAKPASQPAATQASTLPSGTTQSSTTQASTVQAGTTQNSSTKPATLPVSGLPATAPTTAPATKP